MELLSHLAVVLMPDEPIAELFRNFPVEPSEAWGSRWLCPDLSAYGVLKKGGAALFLEYDGYYVHYTEDGCKADGRKTDALLRHGPSGSQVVRLVHNLRNVEERDNSRDLLMDVWQAGHSQSLMQSLVQVSGALLVALGSMLRKDVKQRLGEVAAVNNRGMCKEKVQEFSKEAAFAIGLEDRQKQLRTFLIGALRLTDCLVKAVICKWPQILGLSIEANLKPTVAWLRDLGLSQVQVAKIIAVQPSVLGYSIEANLKPTVAWLHDLGLSQVQVAKIIAVQPSVLGYSIEANLKPTVAWLHDLGLSQVQVAKIIAGFPSVLGTSIEANLKPTVAWLHDLGLSQVQVAKIIAVKPSVLGYSIEANLKPTVAWLRDLGLSQVQVAKIIAVQPSVLGYSIEANLKPTVAWLHDLGLSQVQVAKIIAVQPSVLGYSIEANLKPTVAWLHDLGLSQVQVAKIIAGFPSVLGTSIEANLKPTVAWLHDLGLGQEQLFKIVVSKPQIFGYSIEANLSNKLKLFRRFFNQKDICAMLARCPPLLGLALPRQSHRLHVLQKKNMLAKFASTATLTDSRFAERFPD